MFTDRSTCDSNKSVSNSLKNNWTPIHCACFDGQYERVRELILNKENITTSDKDGIAPIHLACLKGKMDIINLLIENNCDIETPDKNNWRPIHYACHGGNVEVVKALVEKRCNMEAQDKNGWRPIHVTIFAGDIATIRLFKHDKSFNTMRSIQIRFPVDVSNYEEILRFLLHKEGKFEEKDIKGRRPIHMACLYSRLNMAKILIDKNCDIETGDKNRFQPIHAACYSGSVNIAKLLLEKNSKIVDTCDRFSFRPIHYASDFGKTEVVKLLIESNCNIEAYDEDGWRPIHSACNGGHFEIAKLLIENHCSIEECNEAGWRPIHAACNNGNIEIVKLLIGKECDIEAQDKDHHRPIHEACGKGHVKVAELLIQNKCDINASSKRGSQPIHFACINGHADVMKLLIQVHASIENSWALINSACERNDTEMATLLLDTVCNTEQKNSNNVYPIHVACFNGHFELVKLLVSRNCNIEVCTPDNLRPINAACFQGHYKIAQLLIEKNCDIHVRDNKGMQPIHHACQAGHFQIVRLLIEHNCDIEACAGDNLRPIHFTCLSGNLEIMKLLVESNCDTQACARGYWKPVDLALKYRHFEVVKFLQELERPQEVVSEETVLKGNDSRTLEDECFRKLKQEIVSGLELEADIGCDHKFCMNCIDSTKFEKKYIGKGSFGEVTKVTEVQTGHEFAIKEIVIDVRSDPSYNGAKNIEDNINKYREYIHHERVVRYFGAIEISNVCYIFMEYLSQGSLNDRISDKNPIPHDLVIVYSKQVIEGLEFLHRNKFIHRDIKPENILFDEKDVAKLTDLGISRSVLNVPGPFPGDKLLEVTAADGTVRYMAPEILNGEDYSFPCDIWSMGATVVTMLSGHPPYHRLPLERAKKKIMTEKSLEFKSCLPMSEDVKDFVDKMLRGNPSQRLDAFFLLDFLSSRFTL